MGHGLQEEHSLYLVMTPIAYSLADVAVLMGPRIQKRPTSICPYAYQLAVLLDELHNSGLLEKLPTDSFTINNLGIHPETGEAVVSAWWKSPSI